MAENIQAGSEDFRPETEEPIELPFEEQVLSRLDAMESSIRTESSRWNGIQGIYDKNTAAIEQLRDFFTTELGDTKKTAGLFEQYIRESQGDEAWNRYQTQADAAAYRAGETAKPAEQPKQPAPTTAAERTLASARTDAFYDVLVPQAWRTAKRLGLNLDFDAFGAMFGTKFRPLDWGDPEPGDALGSAVLETAMNAVVRTEVNRIKANAKPRTTPAETTRGATTNSARLTGQFVLEATRPSEKSTKDLIKAREDILDRFYAPT